MLRCEKNQVVVNLPKSVIETTIDTIVVKILSRCKLLVATCSTQKKVWRVYFYATFVEKIQAE